MIGVVDDSADDVAATVDGVDAADDDYDVCGGFSVCRHSLVTDFRLDVVAVVTVVVVGAFVASVRAVVVIVTVAVPNWLAAGVTVTVQSMPGESDPYLMPADHPANQAAHAVLTELYERPPYMIRMGGSIPVCPLFRRELGAYTLNFAFGLGDENLHAPDEFFRLSSFRRGQRAYGLLLKALGQADLT